MFSLPFSLFARHQGFSTKAASQLSLFEQHRHGLAKLGLWLNTHDLSFHLATHHCHIDEAGGTLDLGYVYHSNAKKKWHLSQVQSLLVQDNIITLVDGSGTELEFSKNYINQYRAPKHSDAAQRYIIKKDNVYHLIDPETNLVFVFNEQGQLKERRYNQHVWHYHYDAKGRLKQIVIDDRQYQFNWHGLVCDIVLMIADKNKHPLMRYTFNAEDELSESRVYYDKQTYDINYDYDESHQLKCVRQSDGHKLHLQWSQANLKSLYADKAGVQYHLQRIDNTIIISQSLSDKRLAEIKVRHNADGYINQVVFNDRVLYTVKYDSESPALITEIIDEGGTQTIWTYNTIGQIDSKTIKDKWGQVLSSEKRYYSASHELKSKEVVIYQGGCQVESLSTYHIYDEACGKKNCRFSLYPDGSLVEWTYDDNNHPKSKRQFFETLSLPPYFNPENPPSLAWLETKVKSLNHALSQYTEFECNDVGQKSKIRQFTHLNQQGLKQPDATVIEKQQVQDREGRLLEERLRFQGRDVTDCYQRQCLGLLQSQTNALGDTTSYAYQYDGQGIVVEKQTPFYLIEQSQYTHEGELAAVRSQALFIKPERQAQRHTEANFNKGLFENLMDGLSYLPTMLGFGAEPTEAVRPQTPDHPLDMAATRSRTLCLDKGRRGYISFKEDALSEVVIKNQRGDVLYKMNALGETIAFSYDYPNHSSTTTHFAGRLDFAQQLIDDYKSSVLIDKLKKTIEAFCCKSLANKSNRVNTTIQDGLGRERFVVDALGYVTEKRYNSLGQVISHIQYARALTQDEIQQLKTSQTLPFSENHLSGDRIVQHYYDKGHKVLSMDAAGYVTQYQYNGLGKIIARSLSSQAYTNPATRDIQAIKLWLSHDDNVANTRIYYNALGKIEYKINPCGVVEHFTYNERGLVDSYRKYANVIELAYLEPLRFDTGRLTESDNDKLIKYDYDALGREIRAHHIHDAYEKTTEYDKAGHIVSTCKKDLTADTLTGDSFRRTLYQYNAFGEKTHTVSPLLFLKYYDTELEQTAAQFFKSFEPLHTVQREYSKEGLHVKDIDAKGNETLYFYDKADRLLASISPTGIVTRCQYNAFGQIDKRIVYSKRLDMSRWPCPLGAKKSEQALDKLFASLTSREEPAEITRYRYDKRGQLILKVDACGYLCRYGYNAFGELCYERQQIKRGVNEYLETRYQYEARGLRTAISKKRTDRKGKALAKDTIIDEFEYQDRYGKCTKEKRQGQSEKIFTIDKLGRNSKVQEKYQDIRTGQQKTATLSQITYDAFNQVEEEVNQNGLISKHTYKRKDRCKECHLFITKDKQRLLLKKTSETFNIFKQTVATTNALGARTQQTHHASGHIKSTTDADGLTLFKTELDDNGLEAVTVNANGDKRQLKRDGDGHVTRDILTPSEQDTQVTKYQDLTVHGQAQRVTSPEGRQTRHTFDAKQNESSSETLKRHAHAEDQTVTHRHQHNGLNQRISETVASESQIHLETAFHHDALTREQGKTISPAKLKLSTDSIRDKSGRISVKIDTQGCASFDIFDDRGDKVLSISKTGVIRSYQYNDAHQPLEIRRYQAPLDLIKHKALLHETINGEYPSAFERYKALFAHIDTLTSLDDKHASIRYNKLGLKEKIITHFYEDGFHKAKVIAYTYDKNNKKTSQRSYKQILTLDPHATMKHRASLESLNGSLSTFSISPNDRTNHFINDKKGRNRFIISARGCITENVFNPQGQIIQTIDYALTIDKALHHAFKCVHHGIYRQEDIDALEALVKTDAFKQAANHHEIYVFNHQRKPEYVVDSKGLVTRYQYDADGNHTETIRYAKRFNTQILTKPYTQIKAYLFEHYSDVGPQDRQTINVYNNANYITQLVDEEGQTDTFSRYATGSVKEHINAAKLKTCSTYDEADRLIAEIEKDVFVAASKLNDKGRLQLAKSYRRDIQTGYHYDKGTQAIQVVYDEYPDELPKGVPLASYEPRGIRIERDSAERDIGHYQQSVEVDAGDTVHAKAKRFRPIVTKTTLGTHKGYHANGKIAFEQNEAGFYTYYIYDALDRLCFKIAPNGAVTGYKRNTFNQIECLTRYEKPLSIKHAQFIQGVLDVDWFKQKVDDANSLNRQTFYHYDEDGRLYKTTQSKRLVFNPHTHEFSEFEPTTLIERDNFGRQTKVVELLSPGSVQDKKITYYWYGPGSSKPLAIAESMTLSTDGEMRFKITHFTRNTFDEKTKECQFFNTLSHQDIVKALKDKVYPSPEQCDKDRAFAFSYNRRGQRVKTKCLDVYHYQDSAKTKRPERIKSKALVDKTEYGPGGKVFAVTDKAGNKEYTIRDKKGRRVGKIGKPIINPKDKTDICYPFTRYFYNAHGNPVGEVTYALGAIMPQTLKAYSLPQAKAQTKSQRNHMLLKLFDSRGLTSYEQHGILMPVAHTYNEQRELARTIRRLRRHQDGDSSLRGEVTDIVETLIDFQFGNQTIGQRRFVNGVCDTDRSYAIRLNAFNEVIARWALSQPGNKIINKYAQGLLWYSNQAHSTPTLLAYDGAGHETLSFQSALFDLSKLTSPEALPRLYHATTSPHIQKSTVTLSTESGKELEKFKPSPVARRYQETAPLLLSIHIGRQLEDKKKELYVSFPTTGYDNLVPMIRILDKDGHNVTPKQSGEARLAQMKMHQGRFVLNAQSIKPTPGKEHTVEIFFFAKGDVVKAVPKKGKKPVYASRFRTLLTHHRLLNHQNADWQQVKVRPRLKIKLVTRDGQRYYQIDYLGWEQLPASWQKGVIQLSHPSDRKVVASFKKGKSYFIPLDETGPYIFYGLGWQVDIDIRLPGKEHLTIPLQRGLSQTNHWNGKDIIYPKQTLLVHHGGLTCVNKKLPLKIYETHRGSNGKLRKLYPTDLIRNKARQARGQVFVIPEDMPAGRYRYCTLNRGQSQMGYFEVANVGHVAESEIGVVPSLAPSQDQALIVKPHNPRHWQKEYSVFANPIKEIDAEGAVTETDYDFADKLLEIREPAVERAVLIQDEQAKAKGHLHHKLVLTQAIKRYFPNAVGHNLAKERLIYDVNRGSYRSNGIIKMGLYANGMEASRVNEMDIILHTTTIDGAYLPTSILTNQQRLIHLSHNGFGITDFTFDFTNSHGDVLGHPLTYQVLYDGFRPEPMAVGIPTSWSPKTKDRKAHWQHIWLKHHRDENGDISQVLYPLGQRIDRRIGLHRLPISIVQTDKPNVAHPARYQVDTGRHGMTGDAYWRQDASTRKGYRLYLKDGLGQDVLELETRTSSLPHDYLLISESSNGYLSASYQPQSALSIEREYLGGRLSRVRHNQTNTDELLTYSASDRRTRRQVYYRELKQKRFLLDDIHASWREDGRLKEQHSDTYTYRPIYDVRDNVLAEELTVNGIGRQKQTLSYGHYYDLADNYRRLAVGSVITKKEGRTSIMIDKGEHHGAIIHIGTHGLPIYQRIGKESVELHFGFANQLDKLKYLPSGDIRSYTRGPMGPVVSLHGKSRGINQGLEGYTYNANFSMVHASNALRNTGTKYLYLPDELTLRDETQTHGYGGYQTGSDYRYIYDVRWQMIEVGGTRDGDLSNRWASHIFFQGDLPTTVSKTSWHDRRSVLGVDQKHCLMGGEHCVSMVTDISSIPVVPMSTKNRRRSSLLFNGVYDETFGWAHLTDIPESDWRTHRGGVCPYTYRGLQLTHLSATGKSKPLYLIDKERETPPRYDEIHNPYEKALAQREDVRRVNVANKEVGAIHLSSTVGQESIEAALTASPQIVEVPEDIDTVSFLRQYYGRDDAEYLAIDVVLANGPILKAGQRVKLNPLPKGSKKKRDANLHAKILNIVKRNVHPYVAQKPQSDDHCVEMVTMAAIGVIAMASGGLAVGGITANSTLIEHIIAGLVSASSDVGLQAVAKEAHLIREISLEHVIASGVAGGIGFIKADASKDAAEQGFKGFVETVMRQDLGREIGKAIATNLATQMYRIAAKKQQHLNIKDMLSSVANVVAMHYVGAMDSPHMDAVTKYLLTNVGSSLSGELISSAINGVEPSLERVLATSVGNMIGDGITHAIQTAIPSKETHETETSREEVYKKAQTRAVDHQMQKGLAAAHGKIASNSDEFHQAEEIQAEVLEAGHDTETLHESGLDKPKHIAKKESGSRASNGQHAKVKRVQKHRQGLFKQYGGSAGGSEASGGGAGSSPWAERMAALYAPEAFAPSGDEYSTTIPWYTKATNAVKGMLVGIGDELYNHPARFLVEMSPIGWVDSAQAIFSGYSLIRQENFSRGWAALGAVPLVGIGGKLLRNGFGGSRFGMFGRGSLVPYKVPLEHEIPHYDLPFNMSESIGAAKMWSTKARMKAAELPTSGRIRFVPDKKYDPSSPLLRGPNKGFVDRFGNEWVKGPSRTAGQAFEWDVQLSPLGKKQLGWATRDNRHLNISLDGRITHR